MVMQFTQAMPFAANQCSPNESGPNFLIPIRSNGLHPPLPMISNPKVLAVQMDGGSSVCVPNSIYNKQILKFVNYQ